MSFNYPNFFGMYGSIIIAVNTFQQWQSNGLEGDTGVRASINTAFAAANQSVLLEGYFPLVDSQAQMIASWEQSYHDTYQGNLFASLQGPLNTAASDIPTIYGALYEQMTRDAQSVQNNTSSLLVSATSGNTGSGSLIATLLNATTGNNDERALRQIIEVVCTQDQYSGAAAGGEQFQLVGYPTASPYSALTGGSGVAANNLYVSDQGGSVNVLNNGSFDNYAGSVPTAWTVETLTAGNWYGYYSFAGASGETTLSPASAVVSTNGAQAITWTLPATTTWPAGATVNFYLAAAVGAGIFPQLQKAGLTTALISTTRFIAGRIAPQVNNSSLAVPTTLAVGSAYSPSAGVGINTQFVLPSQNTGVASLMLSPVSGGDIVLSQGVIASQIPLSAMTMLLGDIAQFNCAAGSSLTVALEGVGPQRLAMFQADPATLTGAYSLQSAQAWLKAVSSAAAVRITWSSSITAGAAAAVFIDAMSLLSTLDFGHIQFALARGATDFVVGDSFAVTVSNNYAGAFQTYAALYDNNFLRSSATPTIPDSLALTVGQITVSTDTISTELTTTSTTTILNFTPAVSINVVVTTYARMSVSSAALTLTVQWTDGSGIPRQSNLLSGATLAPGSYFVDTQYLNVAANTSITVIASCSAALDSYISATLWELD